MPDDYHQSPHIHEVKGDANYHYHEAPHQKPRRPIRWGWISSGIAALALAGGTLVTTQLNARPVYYCASENAVKYHTDATCSHLKQCNARVKSMPLGQAKDKMELCKACH
ncbi:hypothetical protein Q5H92_22725 [Hymenobacter sp. M29]|uniref:Uncharacterized protein n=1 Tax=Hymenobacter mellowenesis TaxID=3063995 RepID=A0ABT9AH77_9BACT|nr:hypothetical protein [Hymenobacter sp. M29]MDO7849196.1 hypothetical protein [Hymenobacter sp. M29]